MSKVPLYAPQHYLAQGKAPTPHKDPSVGLYGPTEAVGVGVASYGRGTPCTLTSPHQHPSPHARYKGNSLIRNRPPPRTTK